MSVLVVVKVSGDTATFRTALSDRADEFEAFAEKGREAGAVHHRFGVGSGFVLVVDEWETAEAFQQFFGDPQLQEFIATVGADPTAEPEITITEAITSPDQF
jgi:quinol monooxygenase YgiN